MLNIDANAKTVKGQKKGYQTAVLYLAPSTTSGYQTCASASPGCRAACLNTAGRGAFSTTQAARIRKTREFFADRGRFLRRLVQHIHKANARAQRKGLTSVVRLDGTSDLRWEAKRFAADELTVAIGAEYGANLAVGQSVNVFEVFPSVQFYDYTKHGNRRDIPANHHLTFSLAENNDATAAEQLLAGRNVAVVFDHREPKPERVMLGGEWWPVIDGDETDLRFLDPRGVIVGLKAKGPARKDTSGFVRRGPDLKRVTSR